MASLPVGLDMTAKLVYQAPPHPYFVNKFLVFLSLQTGLRCKIVKTKKFPAKSSRIRSYVTFRPLLAASGWKRRDEGAPGRLEGKLLRIIVRRRGEIICKGLAVQAMTCGAAGASRMGFVVSHPFAECAKGLRALHAFTAPLRGARLCWAGNPRIALRFIRGYFPSIPPGGKASGWGSSTPTSQNRDVDTRHQSYRAADSCSGGFHPPQNTPVYLWTYGPPAIRSNQLLGWINAKYQSF